MAPADRYSPDTGTAQSPINPKPKDERDHCKPEQPDRMV
jgi:hypothetical protein